MGTCEEREEARQQKKSTDSQIKRVEQGLVAEGSLNNTSKGCNNETIIEKNNKNNVDFSKTDGDAEGGQLRLPLMNSRRQKTLMKLEQRMEEWRKNEQRSPSNNPDDAELDWLQIIMDMDDHDVEANLRYSRSESTEDPPVVIEPFSRPYHERRYSFAGADEVF